MNNYSNRFEISQLPTEIMIDFHFRTGERGKSTKQTRVVLPPQVAEELKQAIDKLIASNNQEVATDE